MNFRARTSLTVAVLTGLALGGAFAVVAAAFMRLQRHQLDDSLMAVARAEAAEAPGHDFDFSEGPEPAESDVGPLALYGIMFDDAGHTLSVTPPFDVHPVDRDLLNARVGVPFDFRHPTAHMRAVVVPIPGHPGKRLLLASSRDDLDGDEGFLFRAMLAAFVVAVVWAGLVAYWMSGRLIREHQAIASVVRMVAGGNLSVRTGASAEDPEVRQLASDINEMIENLSALVESQQRFIAHAAHELRSPLAALSGELQQALRRERGAEDYKLTIRSALAATRRLTALAADLLALARSRGDAMQAAELMPLETLLQEAIAAVEAIARPRGVQVARPAAAAGWVQDRQGDTVRLLRNLLENAIRYSPPGGTVQVEVASEGSQTCIRVTDSGPGVDRSEHDRVFTPFYRGKDTAGTEGAGLGLGIAREIARSYGGDVTLDDSFSSGARFVVSLPLVRPAEGQPSWLPA